MLPKSYIFWKWTVYGLGTLALFALQYLVLNHIEVWGVRPFLYPMLPAVVSSYEGLRRGSVFSLVLGAVCDMLLVGPFDGFFTLVFTVIGIASAMISENMLPPSGLCALAVSGMAMTLTALARMAIQILSGGGHLSLMAHIAAVEMALSLPALLAIVPLYRLIHRRCASDY